MDYKIESGKVFGPTCLSTHEDFGLLKSIANSGDQ